MSDPKAGQALFLTGLMAPGIVGQVLSEVGNCSLKQLEEENESQDKKEFYTCFRILGRKFLMLYLGWVCVLVGTGYYAAKTNLRASLEGEAYREWVVAGFREAFSSYVIHDGYGIMWLGISWLWMSVTPPRFDNYVKWMHLWEFILMMIDAIYIKFALMAGDPNMAPAHKDVEGGLDIFLGLSNLYFFIRLILYVNKGKSSNDPDYEAAENDPAWVKSQAPFLLVGAIFTFYGLIGCFAPDVIMSGELNSDVYDEVSNSMLKDTVSAFVAHIHCWYLLMGVYMLLGGFFICKVKNPGATACAFVGLLSGYVLCEGLLIKFMVQGDGLTCYKGPGPPGGTGRDKVSCFNMKPIEGIIFIVLSLLCFASMTLFIKREMQLNMSGANSK